MFDTFLYAGGPRWWQEALIASRSIARATLREGNAFKKALAEIEATQWLSREQLDAYQKEKLSAILGVALSSVPYYRSCNRRVVGHSPCSASLLERLPFIDKGVVRGAGRRLLSETRPRPLFKVATSGTTGAPLTMYQDLAAICREHAFVRRQLHWAGYAPGQRMAWIRGDMIVPGDASCAPYWRVDRVNRMLMLSSYHLSERTATAYLEELRAFDPAIIQAYPSAIGFLATYLQSVGKCYGARSLRGIVTSSESLSDPDRQLIEERFGCRVFDWYGQNERVAAIGTCEQGRYHLMSDYSYVELEPTPEGLEIVGTTFNNRAMPLVRYRTGDYVELQEGETCSCGRAFPVIQRIIGRDDDYIKLSDGSHVKRLSNVFKDIAGILEAQIVQDSLHEIVVCVVPGVNYGPDSERRIEHNLYARLGNRIKVRIRPVEQIARTANGKMRNIICNV